MWQKLQLFLKCPLVPQCWSLYIPLQIHPPQPTSTYLQMVRMPHFSHPYTRATSWPSALPLSPFRCLQHPHTTIFPSRAHTLSTVAPWPKSRANLDFPPAYLWILPCCRKTAALLRPPFPLCNCFSRENSPLWPPPFMDFQELGLTKANNG